MKHLWSNSGRSFSPSPRQARQFDALLELLEADAHAPSTVRARPRATDVHIADSLTGLEIDGVRRAKRLADLGAGAGFPGLVLAVALPEAEVRLIESQRRKCGYLERACARAEIGNARVVCARAEEWRGGMSANDAIVARALGPQPVALEYAAPLLRLRGMFVDWRGRRDGDEESASARAAEELGLRLVEVRHVEPYVGARDHHLHVYEKVDETPARFPRRVGVARKRPLGW